MSSSFMPAAFLLLPSFAPGARRGPVHHHGRARSVLPFVILSAEPGGPVSAVDAVPVATSSVLAVLAVLEWLLAADCSRGQQPYRIAERRWPFALPCACSRATWWPAGVARSDGQVPAIASVPETRGEGRRAKWAQHRGRDATGIGKWFRSSTGVAVNSARGRQPD